MLFLLNMNIAFAGDWDIKFSLGSSYYGGNVEKFDLNSSANISHADSAFEYSSFAKITYSQVNSNKTNQELSGGVKFDYRPYATFSPFFALSAYNNEYKDIKLRLSALLGIKYTFYKTSKSDFSISGAGLYENEMYESEMEDKNILRLSIRPKFKQKIGEKTQLQHITFYKVNVEDGHDYLIESETSLTNRLIGKIDINISSQYTYDNDPPELVEKTDVALITSLVFNF